MELKYSSGQFSCSTCLYRTGAYISCFSDEVSLDNKKDDFISEELVSTFTDPADVFDDNEEIFDDDGDTYYTISDNQLVDDNIILSDDEWDSFPRFGWW